MELDNLEYLKNVIFKFLSFESGKSLEMNRLDVRLLCLPDKYSMARASSSSSTVTR